MTPPPAQVSAVSVPHGDCTLVPGLAPRHARRMATLLVVHHSPTPTVQSLTDAVLAGAHDDAIEGVEVVVRPALEANADDVLAADGVPARHARRTSATCRRAQALLRHDLPGGRRRAGRRRVRERGRRDGEAVRALRARALRHRGRDPVGDVDRAGAALEAVGGGALGGRRRGRGGEGGAYELGGTLAALLAD